MASARSAPRRTSPTRGEASREEKACSVQRAGPPEVVEVQDRSCLSARPLWGSRPDTVRSVGGLARHAREETPHRPGSLRSPTHFPHKGGRIKTPDRPQSGLIAPPLWGSRPDPVRSVGGLAVTRRRRPPIASARSAPRRTSPTRGEGSRGAPGASHLVLDTGEGPGHRWRFVDGV